MSSTVDMCARCVDILHNRMKFLQTAIIIQKTEQQSQNQNYRSDFSITIIFLSQLRFMTWLPVEYHLIHSGDPSLRIYYTLSQRQALRYPLDHYVV